MRKTVIAALTLCSAAAIGVQPQASAETSAPQFVSGVLNLNGLGIANADVIARLWPDDDTTRTLPDGASFDFFQAGTTTTRSDGSFAFALDPTTIPPAFIDDAGRVDLEVLAGNGLLMTTQFITVQFINDAEDATEALESSSEGVLPNLRSWVSAQDPAVPAILGMDLGDVVDLGSIRDESVLDDFDIAVPDVGTAAVMEAAMAGGCSQSVGSRRGPYLETFAVIYGDGGVKGRVKQESSATHTLGVGVKHPGSDSWSAGGSQSESAGWGYDSTYTIANSFVKNKVYYRDYYYSCMADGKIYTTTYEKPDGFYEAGPYYAQATHKNYSTCDPGYADHEYHRTSSKNGQFSGGVSLPGANLSAQSGFTSTQEVHYKFCKRGQICGSGGDPWGSAARVSTRTS